MDLHPSTASSSANTLRDASTSLRDEGRENRRRAPALDLGNKVLILPSPD